MAHNIANYWDRYDEAKNYTEVLMRDGYASQASEINEIQSIIAAREGKLARALFKDGDIIRDCQIYVETGAGLVRLGSGEIFAGGQIRNVRSAEFTIPATGTVRIGIVLTEKIISELEDPGLLNPARGHASEGLPGAWRLQVTASWAFAADEEPDNFYGVYFIDDGALRLKEAPPSLDTFNQAIAAYDRRSTGGGTYVTSGLELVYLGNRADDAQMYSLSEGAAQVNGASLDLPTSRTVVNTVGPDLREIEIEVANATSAAASGAGQRITFGHAPAKGLLDCKITVEQTFTLVHGGFQGCSDDLPVTGTLAILEVKQGGTTYPAGTAWIKNGDKVDWSPAGAEPANGSTYTAKVRFLMDYEPEAMDADGFTVKGAVAGTQIIYSYNQMLPRYDRLVLNVDGITEWKHGVAAERNPVTPQIPGAALLLATVYQDWRQPQITNDSPRVVAFERIAAMEQRQAYILQEIARNRLEISAASRENGMRVGMFVDPLLDDSMRDQGLAQTGAVADGELVLPMLNVAAPVFNADIKRPELRNWNVKNLLEQPLATGDMKVNPYQAYDPFPAQVSLAPPVDQWTEVQTQWTSDVTRQIRLGNTRYTWGWRTTRTEQTVETVSTQTTAIRYLRQIRVAFTISGFGVGERLKSATFDGRDIFGQIGAKTADANGDITGSFTIPANVPAGSKLVVFTGAGGTRGTATFVGQGNLTVQTMRNVTSQYGDFYEPVAQTFAFQRPVWLAGVDLWFTAKSTEVRVELREVENGVPSSVILAVKRMAVSAIATNGQATRFLFDAPIYLDGNRAYAFVVMCNDAITRVKTATMGEFDKAAQRWVASQPYTVGTLLSSSNASTWTPHQDTDMTFRLLEASFTGSDRVIGLGSVTVANATDILLNALYETPTSACSVDFTLTLPDKTTMTVAAGQPVNLGKKVSGAIAISARLRGDASASPILYPGAQLVWGTCGESGNYYSRSVDATGAIRAVLMYEAEIPSGSTVTAQIQVDNGAWETLTPTDTTLGDNGGMEFTCNRALASNNLVKIRFNLTGHAAARPVVRNIRLLAVK